MRYPFCAKGSADDAMKNLCKLTPKSLRKSLRKGLNAIDDLSTGDVRIEYSPLSELELIEGRARGRAIEKAAKEGIPDRMWTRIRGKEIDARLGTEDLADIWTRIGSLSSLLQEVEIQVSVSSRPASEVFDLAKEVGRLIYLEFADIVIYASALAAEAEYLLTFDHYLANTVNRVRTGPPPYHEIGNRLRTAVGQILLRDAEDVTLPEAKQRLPSRRQ